MVNVPGTPTVYIQGELSIFFLPRGLLFVSEGLRYFCFNLRFVEARAGPS